VGPVLLDIYRFSFTNETQGSLDESNPAHWNQSLKCLFEVLREYDVYPSLVSKSILFIVFNHTKENPNVYNLSQEILEIKNKIERVDQN
jgi:hypothetical protein